MSLVEIKENGFLNTPAKSEYPLLPGKLYKAGITQKRPMIGRFCVIDTHPISQISQNRIFIPPTFDLPP